MLALKVLDVKNCMNDLLASEAFDRVEMTGKWEAELAKIERGEASADGFTHSIEG